MIYLIFMFTFIRTQRWWRWKKKYFPSPSLLSQKFIVCSSFLQFFLIALLLIPPSPPQFSVFKFLTLPGFESKEFSSVDEKIFSFIHFILFLLTSSFSFLLAFSLGCRLVFFMLSSLLSCLMLNEFKNGNVFVLTSAVAHTKAKEMRFYGWERHDRLN